MLLKWNFYWSANLGWFISTASIQAGQLNLTFWKVFGRDLPFLKLFFPIFVSVIFNTGTEWFLLYQEKRIYYTQAEVP